MRISALSPRTQALAAGLAVIASCLAFCTGAAAAGTVTCPTVDPSTGAVSPAPSAGVDWSGCDLAGADLSQYALVDLNLSYANLSNVDLLIANVNGGDLTGANLTGANLIDAKVSANLTDANLSSANMTGTDLTAATISGAIMGTATITAIRTFNTIGVPASLPAGWEDIDSTILGPTAQAWDAILSGADLAGLDLDQADLSGADLSGTNLSGTDLAQATLSEVESGQVTGTPSLPAGWLVANGYLVGNEANLNGANLSGTDLAGMDLSSTDLEAADLADANLTGTDLDSANLFQVNLTGANLTSASATSANLTSADLDGAVTSGLDLTDANVQGASLASDDLQGVTLTGIESGSVTGTPTLPANWVIYNGYLAGPSANLSGADLDGLNISSLANSDLSGANLSQATLQNASLASANLTNVTLAGADLTGADLSQADLSGASLTSANLTGTNLDGATVTGADFTGATWLNTTCPDGSNSNKHDSGCFSALDTEPPTSTPTLLTGSGESPVNGWFNEPVTVSWGWKDDGTINPAECTRFSTTTTNGPVTLTASCTDLAGLTGTASMSLKVDATRPVVKVTGVRKGQHYVIGKVPQPGCSTSETISGVATKATLSLSTGGSGGVGPFTATCAGAVSVAGLPQSAPIWAQYTIGYGFGGFAAPRPNSSISLSSGRLSASFRLVTASGTAIGSHAAGKLAWAHDIRVVLSGPGIHPVNGYCRWNGRKDTFACSVKLPAGVRAGYPNKYMVTAQENVGTGFYAVPPTGHGDNPEVIYFS